MNDETTSALQNIAAWMQHIDRQIAAQAAQMQELLGRLPEAGATVTPKTPKSPPKPREYREVRNKYTEERFINAAAAARALGVPAATMSLHLRGGQNSIRGMRFEYTGVVLSEDQRQQALVQKTGVSGAPAPTTPGTSATAGPQATSVPAEDQPPLNRDLAAAFGRYPDTARTPKP